MPRTPTFRLDFAGYGPTIPPLLARDAGIAQLVEHDLAKVGVASSSLVSRSKFFLDASKLRATVCVTYRRRRTPFRQPRPAQNRDSGQPGSAVGTWDRLLDIA